MLFKSAVYTQVSGSIGGITYAHNSGGMYARGRGIPTQPNTPRQAAVKAAFAAVATYWSTTLTDGERTLWGTYAANTPLTGPLGDPINVSGQNMFTRANVIRERAGLTLIDAAPTAFNLGEPVTGIDSMVIAAGEMTITLPVGGAGTSDAGRKLLRIGAAMPAGRNYFRGPYQEAGNVIVSASVTSIVLDLTLADNTEWLSDIVPVVGERIPVAFRILYDDGRLSAEYREIVTVT